MAQTIASIRIPFCVWVGKEYLNDDPVVVEGTFTASLWLVHYPDVPILLASATLDASSVPRTFIEYPNEGSTSWDTLTANISDAEFPTFHLDDPITFDESIKYLEWEGETLLWSGQEMLWEPDNIGLMVSLVASGLNDPTSSSLGHAIRWIFNVWPFPANPIGGISAYYRYDFITSTWIDTVAELTDYPARYRLPELRDEDGIEISKQPTVILGWNDGSFYDQVQYYNPSELLDLNNPLYNAGYMVDVDPDKLPPEKPTALMPLDDAVDVDSGLTYLAWTPSPTGTAADYFSVYFDNGSGALPTTPDAVVTGSEWIIGWALQSEAIYTWRVDATNEYGTTTGDEWTFTVEVVENYIPPLTELCVWLSKTHDYNKFKEGTKDADSFMVVVPSTNEGRWVHSLEDLLVGTAGDEWKIGSNKIGTALTPTNFSVKQQTDWGSSRIQPLKSNSAILYVDFVLRKIREMALVDDKHESPNLTVLAEHITKTGITSWCRVKNPESMLLMTLTDGSLISFAYDREQNVMAYAKHPLGGDGFAQSVCRIPGASEDVIHLSVVRTINSAEVVYMEKMMPREFTTKADAFFVDCGITFTSETAVSTITGLSHLEGELVTTLATGPVIGSGIVLDDAIVTNGKITAKLNGETVTVTKANTGLSYTSLLRPMRLVVNDSMGSITRVPEIVLSMLDTGAIEYGDDENSTFPIDLTSVGLVNDSEISGLFTGECVVSMQGGFSTLNPIYVKSDKPLPLTLRCIVARFERTGR